MQRGEKDPASGGQAPARLWRGLRGKKYMLRALELAKNGKGCVEPNPLVGAVMVKKSKIIGEGFHEFFGGSHAETGAIRAAGKRCKGAALYVTLEPCSHLGKTPPCTEAIIKAGIKEVVAAVEDPHPLVKGKGFAILEAAGIKVRRGLLADEARVLNAPYFKLRTQGEPFFIAKWAMTLDGKIATRQGDSHWISSPEARKYVHKLRGQVDAIMVGIGTVLADDPELTARPSTARHRPLRRTPLDAKRLTRRIVVDSRARLPLGSRLVKTARDVPVILATTEVAPKEALRKLARRGVEIIEVKSRWRRVDLKALAKKLGEMELTNVLIEGGGEVLASAFSAGLVDRVIVFVAPKIFGGRGAKTAVEGKGIAKVVKALPIKYTQSFPIGEDIVIEGKVLRVR